MIKNLKDLFSARGEKGIDKYTGLSDFFLRASSDEKKKVITEAARKSNEDQLKVFREARLKTRVN